MGKFSRLIQAHIRGSIDVKSKVAELLAGDLEEAALMLAESLQRNGKILLCGNGGSAADSQHLAAEIVSRLKMERSALPAIALTTDTSILTAIANDYTFDSVFARQVEALGQPQDVLVGITTSGNSKNVIEAVKEAREKEMKVLIFSGKNGGKLGRAGDVNLIVPSNDTQYIQEAHIMMGHILCDMVERIIFSG